MSGVNKSPELLFAIAANTGIQTHFGFVLVGSTLNLVVYKKTVTAGAGEEGKDKIEFVPQSTIPIAENLKDSKEMLEIVKHLRWTFDQLKKKEMVTRSAAIDSQLAEIAKAVAAQTAGEQATVSQLAGDNGDGKGEGNPDDQNGNQVPAPEEEQHIVE